MDDNRDAVRDSHAISDTVTLGDGDTQQTINEEVDFMIYSWAKLCLALSLNMKLFMAKLLT